MRSKSRIAREIVSLYPQTQKTARTPAFLRWGSYFQVVASDPQNFEILSRETLAVVLTEAVTS